MRTLLLAAALSTTASFAAAAERYTLDSSHSQILFSYNHLGFSTTWGMFSGFEGEIMFDQENPDSSTVTVSMPTKSMFTGWEQRDGHFMSGDFFAAEDGDLITFTSTGIEVTGDGTANITGDLTMNDVTKSVVLDATLNQAGTNPLSNKEWAGFNATTTLLRSDFGLGAFAPAVSDEVQVQISIEAEKAE
ncbi:YceI family protein [uncultured Tateyamaria sp.]|uniref:YceI family protein n=1 Tax=uncultured Tateyamaria sp. TaxID=455651 RepID=UPI0026379678|nr:YceI family protein [uncultured Tateyamaria sp.]